MKSSGFGLVVSAFGLANTINSVEGSIGVYVRTRIRDGFTSSMGRALINPLACFLVANVAVLLLGALFVPAHSAAVQQCYLTIFSNLDPWQILQRIVLLAVCLLIEQRILGWTNCSLRKLLWPSRSEIQDLAVGAINICGFGIVLFLFFTANIIPVLPQHTRQLFSIEWTHTTDNILLQTVFWFLLRDFWLYWFHRGLHLFPFAWEAHKYHHSATTFTMLTASRVHFLERGLGHVFVTLPLVMLGLPGETYVFVVILNDGISRFHHSMVDWKLGWLGRLICSPVAHRIHHSSLSEHWDKNFGDVLIIWDHMFGTYYDGKTVNTDVGVSDNYFQMESVFGGLLTSYGLFVQRFFSSLWKNDWLRSSHRKHEVAR